MLPPLLLLPVAVPSSPFCKCCNLQASDARCLCHGTSPRSKASKSKLRLTAPRQETRGCGFCHIRLDRQARPQCLADHRAQLFPSFSLKHHQHHPHPAIFGKVMQTLPPLASLQRSRALRITPKAHLPPWEDDSYCPEAMVQKSFQGPPFLALRPQANGSKAWTGCFSAKIPHAALCPWPLLSRTSGH